MSDDRKNVIAFEQSPQNIARLEKLVHELALDSTCVNIEVEGLGQGPLMDITLLDVLRLLRSGKVQPNIERGSGDGEWICRVSMTLRGSGEVTAVTIIIWRSWLRVLKIEREL